MNAAWLEAFQHSWTVKMLHTPPLIAPARQFTYPMLVPGEEDALQRGALRVEVTPAQGGTFLATAALGFRDAAALSGICACPNPDDLLILSGGYAYLIHTLHPEKCEQLPLRPVTAILAAPRDGLLLLSGHYDVLALSANGTRWRSKRVSWEGTTLERIENGKLYGTGWSMPEDRDVPFTMDLLTGDHHGGGFTPQQAH